jgi:hypothetical protein
MSCMSKAERTAATRDVEQQAAAKVRRGHHVACRHVCFCVRAAK